MAIDFNDLVDKLGDQLDAEKDLLVKKSTQASGASKEMRDFVDLAQLQTIAKNQAAAEDREDNGMFSVIERGYD